jgi:hypothetical protein
MVHPADAVSYSQGFSADICETTPPGSPIWDRPVSPLLSYEAALYSSMNVADRSPVSPTGSILYTSDSVYSGSPADSTNYDQSEASGSLHSPAGPSYADSFTSPNHRYSTAEYTPIGYLEEPRYYVPPTHSHPSGNVSITSSLSEVPPTRRPFSGTDYLPRPYVNEGTFLYLPIPRKARKAPADGTSRASRTERKAFTASGLRNLVLSYLVHVTTGQNLSGSFV